MTLSNYLENKFLNTLKGTSFSAGTTYIKLHTANPGEDGVNAAAENATRKLVTWNTVSSGAMSNSVALTWTSVPALETYAWVSLWDSAGPTGGNCLAYGQLTTTKSVSVGDNVTFAIGAITFTLD